MVKQLNVRLSEDAIKELDELKRKLNLPSIAEVIRSSISLAKFLELEKENGNEVVLRNTKTDKERILVMVR